MRRQHLVLGALLAAPLFGQGTYTIENIAPPAGFATATATGINLNGLVTGFFTTALDANGNSSSRGFLYDAQHCTLQNLEQINGFSTTAAAINNAGLVVGTTQTGNVQNPVRGFASWQGFYTDLGGNLQERALGLNNNGLVVGSETPGGQLPEAAVFWRTCLKCRSTFPWTLEPIETTGPFSLPKVTVNPPFGTAPVTKATAINDSGMITGFLPVGVETWGLALFPGATTWSRIAPVPAIPGISGLELSTRPKAINIKGNIVGVAGTTPVAHAFISRDFLLPAIDLGTLNPSDPNMISAAQGINSNDWVVGTSTVNPTDFPHAFLHNGTSMIDLNARVANGQGWLLTLANAINDNGWIVGTGIHNNRQEGFVLVPQILSLPLNPCTPIVSVPFNGGLY